MQAVELLLTPTLYKRNQGKMVRSACFFLCALLGGAIVRSIYFLANPSQLMPFSATILCIAFLSLLLILWLPFRVTQAPLVADFLIDVQSELAKVTWSSYAELKSSTTVVLATMLLVAAYLFLCDAVWQVLLRLFGVLRF